MPTDLPEPVVPAIRRCGMRERSTVTDSPPIFLPSASASRASVSWKSGDSSSSRSTTISRRSLGSSMPMALRPGTTATRAATALMERAMSSASPMTREDLVPGAGSSSYSVTTGPGRTLVISPLTPKSWSTPSSSRAFSCKHFVADGGSLVRARLRLEQLERRGLVGRVAPLHAGAGMLFLLRGARDAIVGLGDVVALVVLLVSSSSSSSYS